MNYFMCRSVLRFSLLIPKQRLRFAYAGHVSYISSDSGFATASSYRETFTAYPSTSLRRCISSVSTNRKQQFEIDDKKSESVDDNGKWTVVNSKAKLNTFRQNNNIQNDYKYAESGPAHAKEFVAEMDLYVSKLDRTISGKGHGRTKSSASGECAISLVKQLYHLGVLESCHGTLQEKKPKVTPDALQTPYAVAISPEMIARLEDCLHQLNIKPTDIREVNAIDEVETNAEAIDNPLTMTWAPPNSEWDTWRNRKIENDTRALDAMNKTLLEESLRSNETLKQRKESREQLPSYKHRSTILDLLKENQVVVVRGSTGCGKTTQIPQYILEDRIASGQGAQCNIVVTQPRRLSTVGVAARIAYERNESIGNSVGYSIRFDSKFPRPFGSILFCTVGMLLRRLERGLNGVTHVIIDEVHERSIDIDTVLALVRSLCEMHADLRVILMSATIDATLFSDYFGKCPIIDIEGRMHPVKQYFLEDCIKMTGNTNSTVDSLKADDTKNIDNEMIVNLLLYIESLNEPGDVLIFLPGWNEILTLKTLLIESGEFSQDDYLILPCHSLVPLHEQQKIFSATPPGMRKIILSTNIAESSITIDNIVYVIDSAKARIKVSSPTNNMVVFDTVWASQSNLQQRRGRAGRVQPGICFTICPEEKAEQLDKYPLPEIHRIQLHSLFLRTKLLGINDVPNFIHSLIEPPAPGAVADAEEMLKNLGALDAQNNLTYLGRILAKLPLEPRIGKMMILGNIFGVGDITASLASYADSSVFITELGSRALSSEQQHLSGMHCSDHVVKAVLLDKWRNLTECEREEFCRSKEVSFPIADLLYKTKMQICDIMVEAGFPKDGMTPIPVDPYESSAELELAIALLCDGLYPNICLHLQGKDFLTRELRKAKIDAGSVNRCRGGVWVYYRYPFFTFDEKLKTAFVSCRQLTMVAPIHVLLFGSRKLEVIDESNVRLDGWLDLEMDPYHASLITALRPAIDNLITISSKNPAQTVLGLSSPMQNLVEVVKDLCRKNAGDYNL